MRLTCITVALAVTAGIAVRAQSTDSYKPVEIPLLVSDPAKYWAVGFTFTDKVKTGLTADRLTVSEKAYGRFETESAGICYIDLGQPAGIALLKPGQEVILTATVLQEERGWFAFASKPVYFIAVMDVKAGVTPVTSENLSDGIALLDQGSKDQETLKAFSEVMDRLRNDFIALARDRQVEMTRLIDPSSTNRMDLEVLVSTRMEELGQKLELRPIDIMNRLTLALLAGQLVTNKPPEPPPPPPTPAQLKAEAEARRKVELEERRKAEEAEEARMLAEREEKKRKAAEEKAARLAAEKAAEEEAARIEAEQEAAEKKAREEARLKAAEEKARKAAEKAAAAKKAEEEEAAREAAELKAEQEEAARKAEARRKAAEEAAAREAAELKAEQEEAARRAEARRKAAEEAAAREAAEKKAEEEAAAQKAAAKKAAADEKARLEKERETARQKAALEQVTKESTQKDASSGPAKSDASADDDNEVPRLRIRTRMDPPSVPAIRASPPTPSDESVGL